jgi:predicted nicotinamide N-methyase
MNSKKTGEEISIPVGDLRIRMLAPQDEADSDSRITFWWGITSAAVALARHIESHRQEFSGKRVIELGCGLGLAGITAGLAGANVLFTDYVPQALVFAEKNTRLNNLENGTFGTEFLDWEHPGGLPKFDVVLGPEIVYDYFFHGSLIRLLAQIVQLDGAVLLADRKRLCVSRFIGRMTAAGFRSTETVCRVVLAGFPDQEISIFALSKS